MSVYKKNSWLSKASFAAWWFEEEDLKAENAKFEVRAKKLSDMGVNAVITFGYHFRWDWVERLDEVEAMYKKMIDVCHKYKIKVCEHHSATLTSRPQNDRDRENVTKKFPHHNTGGKIYCPDDVVLFEGQKLNDWYQVDAQSNDFTYTPYFGNAFCPNNPGYQKGYLDLVKRLLVLGIDALMSDDVEYFGRTSCVCEHCKRLFKEKYGVEIPPYPNDMFWNNYENPDFCNYLKFRVEAVAKHYKRLKEIDNAVPLFHCCTRSSSAWVAQNYGISYSDTGRYCDLTFQEVCESNIPYHSYLRLGAETHLNNAVRRYYGMTDSLIMMYPYTDEEYYINWAYAKSYNEKLWNCPGAQCDKKWNDQLDLWRKAVNFENSHPELFEKTDFHTDIAILFPRRSRLIYGGFSDDFITNEYCGFCETFMENNIMFDVLMEEELLSRLPEYKTLVLPNAACLSDKEINAICDYVKKGGKVISTDKSGQYDENGKKREAKNLLNLLGIDAKEKITSLPCSKGKITHLNCRPGIMCCSPFYYLHPKSKEVIVYKDERSSEEMNLILESLRRIMPEGLCIDVDAEQGITVSAFEYKGENRRYVIHIVNRKGALLENGSSLNRKFSENIHYPELKKTVRIKIKTSFSIKFALFHDPIDPANCYMPEITKGNDSFTVDIDPARVRRYGILELK